MDKDLPDFLSDAPQAAPEVAQEPAAQAEGAPSEAAQAPPEANLAPAPDPAPEAAPADQQHGFVPIAALLDERDKRQAADAEAKRLREWREQQEAMARRQPPPSLDDDPHGFHEHQAAQIQSALYDQKLAFSQRMAVVEHGKDAVEAAKDWYNTYAAQDPFFDRKVASSDDPYGVVIVEWKRQQLLSKVDPTDLDAFLAWKAQQAGQAPVVNPNAPAGAPIVAQPGAPKPPRPSMAAAPSAGSHAAPDAKDGAEQFKSMFS